MVAVVFVLILAFVLGYEPFIVVRYGGRLAIGRHPNILCTDFNQIGFSDITPSHDR